MASTSTDNEVIYDKTRPTVTINQASTQADPTNSSIIIFTVIFSEPVSDFVTAMSPERYGERDNRDREW